MKVFEYNNGNPTHPHRSKNWGDIVSHPLVKTISQSEKVTLTNNSGDSGKLIVVGSVLQHLRHGDLVWGGGCIDQNHISGIPQKVFAVRGPLTRHELLSKGIECPPIYGDPALLMPYITDYKRKEPKYKYGLIPHYADENEIQVETLKERGVKIIDICGGLEKFIEDIMDVEFILSSSLHGLIAADAWGIPNARVIIKGTLYGGHFKFIDYCLSVNRKIDYGYQLTSTTSLEDLSKIHYNDKIQFNPEQLVNSAPWLDNDYKHLFY
jgi:pyruvyltransferase